MYVLVSVIETLGGVLSWSAVLSAALGRKVRRESKKKNIKHRYVVSALDACIFFGYFSSDAIVARMVLISFSMLVISLSVSFTFLSALSIAVFFSFISFVGAVTYLS